MNDFYDKIMERSSQTYILCGRSSDQVSSLHLPKSQAAREVLSTQLAVEPIERYAQYEELNTDWYYPNNGVYCKVNQLNQRKLLNLQ